MEVTKNLDVSVSLLVGEYRDRIDSVHRKDEKSNKVFLAISILLLAFYAALFSSATDKLSFSYEYSLLVYVVFFVLLFLHLCVSVLFYLSFYQSISLVDSARLLDMCEYVEEHERLDTDLFLFAVSDLLSRAVVSLDEAIDKKNESLNHLFCMAKHLTFFTLLTLFFLFFVKFYGLHMSEDTGKAEGTEIEAGNSEPREGEKNPTIRERLQRVAPEALTAKNQITLEGYEVNKGEKGALNG